MKTHSLKRDAKVVVISDIHLGSYGARAKELAHYLKTIKPEILILNGDIIDGWAFSKNFWPKSHTKVLQRILKLMSHGTSVYYLTGNHDEILRRYAENRFGNFYLLNKLVLRLGRETYWFFHGDVFDITMKNSRWLAKLGGKGYDLLIIFNHLVNYCLSLVGRERISFSKRIKNSVKRAVKFISDFENTVADLAIENDYDYVVCGHIHQPEIKTITTGKGSVIYMNSGDWIENLTSLEYANGKWSLYSFAEEISEDQEPDEETPSTINLYENLIRYSMHR